MLRRNYQRVLDLSLVFLIFFLSNATAFLALFWIAPEIVIIAFVIWLLMAMACLWNMHRHDLLHDFLEHSKRIWIIFPFLIFSGLSIFWSVYWEISLCRWLTFLFTIVAGGYIGLRYTMKKIIDLLSVFGIYILFLSTILVLFVPRIGVMNYYIIQNAWKGVYWHKNHMGLIAAFAAVLFLINLIYSLEFKRKHALFWGILYVFSTFFVYQTDSVAAYLTILFLHGAVFLAFVWLRFREKIRSYHYFVFFAALICASVILFVNIDRFFGVFNRTTTLTGRTLAWHHLLDDYFSKRPFGGYGFNAFWYIHAHRAALGREAGYPNPIFNADNGFLDILVNTGFSGLTLFMIFYFGVWGHSIAYARKAKDLNGIFPVILMTYLSLANISWSLIFENEGFFMLIMIIVLFRVSADANINVVRQSHGQVEVM